MWLDNFNKFRYARNVNEERNRCINGTVMSVLPLPTMDGSLWTGWAPLSHLVRGIPMFAAVFSRAVGKISNEVKTLQQQPLQFSQVRVPCDVRRIGVRNLEWTPWMVYGDNVGSTLGLLAAIEHLIHAQSTVNKTMPVIADVNVFYRMMKMLYHKQVVEINFRGACITIPCCSGFGMPTHTA